MGEVKGTGMVTLKKIINDMNPNIIEKIQTKLTPAESQVFNNALAFRWDPIEAHANVYKKSADMLFPNDPNALKKTGKLSAKIELNTIYKVLLRFTTLNYILGQNAKIWSTYHNQGKASVELGKNDNVIYFVIEDYPDLPEAFREMLCGYVGEVIEMSGKKNVVVTKEGDRSKWRWKITWL